MRIPTILPFLLVLAALPMTTLATAPAAHATAPHPSLPTGRTALVLHGGAGVIERADLSADEEAGIRADLAAARDAGQAILAAGGSALDAVTATVRVLEESPHFNAGKGAVFNAQGRHELDASIMEGHTRRAGAMAGVATVRSPILGARAVMEHSPHVLLMGDGAEAFADTRPELERVPNTWFDTPHRLEQLRQAQARETAEAAQGDEAAAENLRGKYFGTVGAVALDAAGHIATATSTGGMTNKRFGRVGDSPLVGAGTWADERCGVSGTGWGEFFIRAAVAHDICARVAYKGDSLRKAADDVVLGEVPRLGGDGGAIALDRDGHIAMPFNTSGMYRAWVNPDGTKGVAIFADEAAGG